MRGSLSARTSPQARPLRARAHRSIQWPCVRIVSKTRAACNARALNAYEPYRYFNTPSTSAFLSYSSVCARRCNCVLGSQLSSADVAAPRFVPRPSINLTAGSRPLRLRRMRRWLSPPPRVSPSVAQSCLTLRPHGLPHARPPCPSPTPRAYSSSCPLSR